MHGAPEVKGPVVVGPGVAEVDDPAADVAELEGPEVAGSTEEVAASSLALFISLILAATSRWRRFLAARHVQTLDSG